MKTDKLINEVRSGRTENNMTQEELADVVGVTRQTIIAIEQNKYSPSLVLALNIARRFNKTVDEVFKLRPNLNNINDLRLFLIERLKEHFGRDEKRINHALKVLDYAEQIQEAEGGSQVVVKAAAILHDVGIKQAEELFGKCTPKDQETYGPIIAREILLKAGTISDEDSKHICRIIGSHHSANDINTIEFRIIWDADWLVNIPDEYPDIVGDKLVGLIHKVFKTKAGRALAKRVLS